jgi:hypothetical protein
MIEERQSNSGKLSRLVQHILETADADGSWAFPTDKLIQWLGETPEVFYRSLYQIKERIDYWEALDSLSSLRSGDLVSILESLYGPAAEETLRQAGLFLSHEDHIEITDVFLRTAGRAAARHTPDYEQFQAMLRAAKGFPEALKLYYEEHLPLNPMMEAAFEAFAARREWPGVSVAHRLVIDYLESLFQRHILDRSQLFSGLESDLGSRFFDTGERRKEAARLPSEDNPILNAMSLMGLSGRRLDPMVLQSRYRSLMKRYHPDINPQGLEMCKRVNLAYAFLLSLCQEPRPASKRVM